MLSFLLSISEEQYHSKIEYLFNTYHSDMIRFAKYRLKTAGISSYNVDAEDAVQSAFLKIIKYIDRIDFHAGEKEIQSYVLSIVSNEVADILKSNKPFDCLDDYADQLSDTSFIDQLQVNERYEQVVRILRQMDDRYRTVLQFRYVNDMSVKAISDLIGISEKAVYARLERGKRLLLERLDKEDTNEQQ